MSDQSDTPNNRRRSSFEQAEGAEPIPSQLALKEVSQEMRAHLWRVFHDSIEQEFSRSGATSNNRWITIMRDWHVERSHGMVDEFDQHGGSIKGTIKGIISEGNYVDILGFSEWVIRHPSCPLAVLTNLDNALQTSRAAYRVVDGDTIVPIASEVDRQTVERAFFDLSEVEFNGARAHLKNAATNLTAGKYADSVRESIHAVESVARILAPTDKLSDALGRLESSLSIHGSLKRGFAAIYGYTSDEKGIRHPLLEEDAPRVDETDALFMLGACAAFLSYLVNKGTVRCQSF